MDVEYIRGYYDRRKIIVDLGCNFLSLYLSGRLSRRRGGDRVKQGDGELCYFSSQQTSPKDRT